MPTFAGIRYRARMIRDAMIRPFSDLNVYPVARLGPFDLLTPLVPGLPALPPELTAAVQPEIGQQAVIESGEPEVARTLFSLARLLGAVRVAEVGVFRGYTSQFLAAAVEPFGGTLHLVDLSADALTEAAERAGRYAGCRIERHCGLSTDPAVLAAIPPGCDLVFLDADHSEEGVEAELAVWLPKVRVGGVLAIHDSVNMRGVCRAVNRRAATCPALTIATSRGSGLTLFRPGAGA